MGTQDSSDRQQLTTLVCKGETSVSGITIYFCMCMGCCQTVWFWEFRPKTDPKKDAVRKLMEFFDKRLEDQQRNLNVGMI